MVSYSLTGVLFARGAAAALKLNCAVILIPVLRNFLAWSSFQVLSSFLPSASNLERKYWFDATILTVRRLRGTWFNNVLPIDHAIWFHQFVGWLIAFFSAMHT
jgi:hypothetical protein